MRPQSWPLLPYVLGKAAGALDLTLYTEGSPRWQDFWTRERATLASAWKQRKACGSAYLRACIYDGELYLEVLDGRHISASVPPGAPARWEYVSMVCVSTEGGSVTRYIKEKNGPLRVLIKGKKDWAEVDGYDGWPLPIIPLHRESYTYLVPQCDRTLLELHLNLGVQLTDADYRRRFRVDQPWRRGKMDGPGSPLSGGSDSEGGPDCEVLLDDGEEMGVLSTSYNFREDLQYIEDAVRLASQFFGLPPELFASRSRAETGLAKEWDNKPERDMQTKDRLEAAEFLRTLATVWRPIFDSAGLARRGENVRLQPYLPPEPEPRDPLQQSQADRENMALGLTSPVYILAKRRGVSFATAENLIRANREQVKKYTNLGVPRE